MNKPTSCDNPQCKEQGVFVNPETGICPKCGGWGKDITNSEVAKGLKDILDN